MKIKLNDYDTNAKCKVYEALHKLEKEGTIVLNHGVWNITKKGKKIIGEVR